MERLLRGVVLVCFCWAGVRCTAAKCRLIAALLAHRIATAPAPMAALVRPEATASASLQGRRGATLSAECARSLRAVPTASCAALVRLQTIASGAWCAPAPTARSACVSLDGRAPATTSAITVAVPRVRRLLLKGATEPEAKAQVCVVWWVDVSLGDAEI